MSLQDNTNLVCEFQTLKLIKELELEETKARQNLKDSCRQLLSRVLSLKDNNELIQTHWLETIIYRENSVDAVFYDLGDVDSPAFQVRPSNAYRLEDNPADCHCKPRVLHVLVFKLKHISHGYCS